MNLHDLFGAAPLSQTKLSGSFGTREVSALVFDTRLLKAECVFIAIRGGRHDGHDFLSDAMSAGAIALVVEDRKRVPLGFSGLVHEVPSSRVELARLAALWSKTPSRELFTIGVTGTNGKTTTTNMIETVLNGAGLPTGVIGTIDHHLGSRVWPSDMTTPDPLQFQARLRDFVDHGAKAVALEVSSHALDQARIDAVDFDVGVFTNLTRDHLDYHGTMEAYFAAKLRFFTELLRDSAKTETRAIVNIEDAHGKILAEGLKVKSKTHKKPGVWTMGSAETAESVVLKPDFSYRILKQGFDGVEFDLVSPAGSHRLHLAMAGVHNVQNAVSAFAVGLAAGVEVSSIERAIESIRGVNGRLEHVVNSRGLHVFVDYAHTDDALAAILRLLGDIREESGRAGVARPRIHTVFGCGGDRDRGKRPLMMRAALAGSDRVYVTSDNPRTEDPEKIIDDAMVVVGAQDSSRVERITDRREAIARALTAAQVGDVILIAGKGHEATQTIGTVKTPFSDAKVAKDILEGFNGRG